ncbi:hypothetical protein BY996DRAFT_56346 [Phakopsora pachyrhizi]|nr:hypothetical protein BY996DRAFT_56346 [Phakopsora pachyrhizi]
MKKKIKIKRAFKLEMRRAEESQLIGVAFGFTFGFGFLVARNALKQTHKANHFIVMVWIELIICLISSTLDFLFLIGAVRGTVPFFITILVLWSCQIQILFQIIINRISLIWLSENGRNKSNLGSYREMPLFNYRWWFKLFVHPSYQKIIMKD